MADFKNTIILDDGYLQLPVGTTAQRPASPVNGDIRFNSQFKVVENYINGAWKYMPPIVEDGLVLHLDAAEPASYSGSGTTWTDLSGNGNNGTLVNGPTYDTGNAGSLDFNGTDDYGNFNLSSISTNYLTIEMWCKRNDSSGSEYHWDARNGGGTWFLSEYNGFDWNWGNVVRFNDNDLYVNWHQIVAIKNDTVSYLYKNGILKAIGGDVNGTLGNDFRIATRYTNSSFWNGNISSFKIYNRALSAAEIQQNFTALRGRYGI